MSLQICIGLEIHLSVKTDYKMFSPDKSDSFSWTSCGFLGTLPSINFEAIKKTIQLSYALNSEVNYQNIRFDRKNYFYYDLPRGFQITQFFHPIGKKGNITLSNGKKINIRQIHLEEDTAQQIKSGHTIRLLFPRLGQALIEVVTEPDFSSYKEVDDFLKRLRWVCLLFNISDASYSRGQMRVDLNFSVKDPDTNYCSAKSEVKNLNSCEALEKSIKYLFNKKKKLLSEGIKIESYTYAWVEKLNKCEIMRKKDSFKQYFYIPEANIPQIIITQKEYKEMIKDVNMDLDKIIQTLEDGKLKKGEIIHLLNNPRLFQEVFKLNKHLNNLISSYNWVVNIISGIVNKSEFKDYSYDEVEKAVINFEITKDLSIKQSKSIIKEIITKNVSYKRSLSNLGIKKITNDNYVLSVIKDIFNEHSDQIPKLIENSSKLSRFIIGECMKRTSGQADPQVANKCFQQVLKEYLNTKKN